MLKTHLSTAPILSFPQFNCGADNFTLYTDADSVGIGAVLEQSGKIIAYANRALTAAEKQYSTIQKECLAIVYATKQFCHYLLGQHFKLFTDHAPLQWLSTIRWKGCYVDGPLHSKNLIFQLCIGKEHNMSMPMHYQDNSMRQKLLF